jgi:outer membrane protein
MTERVSIWHGIVPTLKGKGALEKTPSFMSFEVTPTPHPPAPAVRVVPPDPAQGRHRGRHGRAIVIGGAVALTLWVTAVLAAESNDVVAPSDSAAGPPAPTAISLSLSNCLSLALTKDPGLAARSAEVAQARAQRDGAAGARWPSVHALGNYAYATLPQVMAMPTANGQPMVFDRNLAGGDVVAALPLFTGGQLSSRLNAARLLEAAAQHRLVRTREELLFSVSAAFYSQLGQRHIVESVEFSQRTLAAHRQRIRDLLEAKKAVRVDLLRTEVRLADVQQRLVQENNLLAIQQRLLATLLGGGQPVFADGELPVTLQSATTEGALVLAEDHRADLLAARREVDAQKQKVAVARGAHWPQVYGRAAYSERYAPDADLLPGQSDELHTGFVGVTVDLPLFEGGQISARVREEEARLTAAQERLRQLDLQIQLEVESAALNVNSSRERALATAKSVEQARESLAIERDKYNAGKGTIVDVLDAQSALLEAQTAYYRALADHQIALAQLQLAEGEDR